NHMERINSMRVTLDGRRIVQRMGFYSVRVTDFESGQLLTEAMAHEATVTSIELSPDGKQVLTASLDGTARLWDAEDGKPLFTMPHRSGVNSAEFSPDGSRIVTASLDGTARVWNTQNGQPLTWAAQHVGPVNFAQFSPEGKRVVTASQDSTARVW